MTKYSNGDVVSYSECGDQGKVVGHTDSGRVLVDYGSGHIVAESPDFLILVSPAVEQQDDKESSQEDVALAWKEAARLWRVRAEKAEAAQSQGVEAWGVFRAGVFVTARRYEGDAKSYLGATVRRVRVVEVDEPVTGNAYCDPDRAHDDISPAVDELRRYTVTEYAKLNRGVVVDGPTDDRTSDDTHMRRVTYSPWVELPKPVPVTPDLETVLLNTGCMNAEDVAGVAAVVREHFEGTGK